MLRNARGTREPGERGALLRHEREDAARDGDEAGGDGEASCDPAGAHEERHGDGCNGSSERHGHLTNAERPRSPRGGIHAEERTRARDGHDGGAHTEYRERRDQRPGRVDGGRERKPGGRRAPSRPASRAAGRTGRLRHRPRSALALSRAGRRSPLLPARRASGRTHCCSSGPTAGKPKLTNETAACETVAAASTARARRALRHRWIIVGPWNSARSRALSVGVRRSRLSSSSATAKRRSAGSSRRPSRSSKGRTWTRRRSHRMAPEDVEIVRQTFLDTGQGFDGDGRRRGRRGLARRVPHRR